MYFSSNVDVNAQCTCEMFFFYILNFPFLIVKNNLKMQFRFVKYNLIKLVYVGDETHFNL